MEVGTEAALAYHEPSIVVILVQGSFLLLLNVLNWFLDSYLYCGLIGQILVGVAWGTPGARLLSDDVEHVAVQLGYIGLILLVFEGGLSTTFRSLRANLVLALGVAITGVAVPIGLSFLLESIDNASKLQCFAAGAALCSTSLGTTFTVLRTSGLTETRLGVVLSTAAMLDDIVGLVMVQVISNLGSGNEPSLSAVTVVRPVLVSAGFLVLAVAACRLVLQPMTLLLNGWRTSHADGLLDCLLRKRAAALVLHTMLLVALVTASSYAGTSNLFAAYIAGAVISWWDSEVPHLRKPLEQRARSAGAAGPAVGNASARQGDSGHAQSPQAARVANGEVKSRDYESTAGSSIFDHYYRPALKWILQPLFFASIGFSIPISRMFAGRVIWRGVVYAILMLIGKLSCGLWLIRFPGVLSWAKSILKNASANKLRAQNCPPARNTPEPDEAGDDDGGPSNVALSSLRATNLHTQTQLHSNTDPTTIPNPPKPLSLYPACILGLAMVARGEIGFLVSSIAESNGVFGKERHSGIPEIFLVVTWGIVLCTLAGPLSVGLLVRRVRRLQTETAASAGEADASSANDDVLGVWGTI